MTKNAGSSSTSPSERAVATTSPQHKLHEQIFDEHTFRQVIVEVFVDTVPEFFALLHRWPEAQS